MSSFPYDKSSFLNDLFLGWIFKIINYYRRLHPSSTDPILLPSNIDIQPFIAKLNENWSSEQSSSSPSFLKAMMKTIYVDYIKAVLLIILTQTIVLLLSLLVNYLVIYVGDPAESVYKGALLVAGFGVFLVCAGSFRTNSGLRTTILIGKIKATIAILVSEKILRLQSNLISEKNTRGKIINSISSDLELLELAFFTVFFWCIPFSLMVAMLIISHTFGNVGLIGIGISAMHIPIVICVGGIMTNYRKKSNQLGDERVKLTENLIEGIKIMKLYGWELPYLDSIFQKRKAEINQQTIVANLNGILQLLGMGGVPLIVYASMTIQIALDGILYPSRVFLLATIYFSLHMTIVYLTTMGINVIFMFINIMKRTGELLLLPEATVNNDTMLKANPISLSDVKLSWKNKKKPSNCISDSVQNTSQSCTKFSLSKLTFKISSGEVLMVVGPVGSGKTSLLLGIIGEISLRSGSLDVCGSVAYTSEDPWLISGSIRDNILMGREFIEDVYYYTLKCCALTKDLELLVAGDETIIGDRGITLSGGQRTRVSLARAIYSQADIFVLDDPLSAVDAEVANSIMQECIKGQLNGKTVVLATHQLQFLSQADKILVLNQGEKVFYGDYKKMKKSKKVGDLLGQIHFGKKNIENGQDERIVENGEHCEKMVIEEDINNNSARFQTYIEYLKYGFKSNILVMIVLLIMCFSQFVFLLVFYWASQWSQQFDQSSAYYTRIMGILVAVCYASACVRIFIIINLLLISNKNLHNKALKSIAMAPSLYFDENPTGRIISRFTKDIGIIDGPLQYYMYETSSVTIGVIGFVVVTLYVSLYNFIVLPFWVIWLVIVLKYVGPLIMRFRKVEQDSKNPMLITLNSILNGLPVIRSLGIQKKFKEEIYTNAVNNYRAYMTLHILQRFSMLYFDYGTGMLIILNVIIIIASKGDIDITLSAYSLSCSAGLSAFITIWSKNITELGSSMSSAERLMDLYTIPNEGVLETQNKFIITQGKIEFENVYMKYKQKLPYALAGLSFTIFPGSKVGIIGRTGAGKSSILQVLFRLVNPEKGMVYLDGFDYMEMGLHDLRRQMSVIPQSSMLFAASIKENIDPFNLYSDDEILKALSQVNLVNILSRHEKGIHTEIRGDEISFSAGEKQLLCLARVILRKNKIIVMDEATANVDNETDRIMQGVIAEEFKETTLLMIAHRIRTVIKSDFIMVIENGSCKEYGSPIDLYYKEASLFQEIVTSTGKEESKFLIQQIT